MLTVPGQTNREYCDGTSRRNFLKVGALGLGGLSLPGLLRARAHATEAGMPTRDTSVVLLWLSGGPTHVETFDPKMSAPSEYRSTVGAVDTSVPGLQIGGHFPQMATVADKMAFVRSFAHQNSGHGGGTHWVMTGYNNTGADNGAEQMRPSYGSILSRVRGPNHPVTGMPTYVRVNGISFDGPAWLGAAYGPFDSGGEARRNMELRVNQDRLSDRRSLLSALDRVDRQIDSTGLMEGLDGFEQQAFGLVLGRAKEAFDLSREDPRTRARYGGGLGDQMLLARRLCEAGCGFVTINYGGWDMHGQIARNLERRCPDMDRAVTAFVDDVHQRGLSDNILLVITGEFGRTPRVNGNQGRDHWAPLSTLALAGGGLRMGQAVGESNSKAEVPATNPYGPQDLMATLFHVLGIDPRIQFVDPSGRPIYMNEDGHAMEELV